MSTTTNEALVFLYSCLSGLSVGLLYDLFRIIRKEARADRILTNILDCFFVLCAALIVFFTVYFSNSGKLRWYEYFGTFLGFLIYELTLSRRVLKVISVFLHFFFIFFTKILNFLLTPLKFMYNIVLKNIIHKLSELINIINNLFLIFFCFLKRKIGALYKKKKVRRKSNEKRKRKKGKQNNT